VARYLLRRILLVVPVLWAVATLTFFLVRAAPGDPFSAEKSIPEESRAEIEAFYGLDQPLAVQYLRYLGNLLRLDPGYSYSHPGFTVAEIIRDHFPTTLAYALPGFALALFLGVGLGLLAALRRGGWGDFLASTLALAGICLPTFVIGPLLALLLGAWLGLLPTVGWSGGADFGAGFPPWAYAVLPALTLGFLYTAFITRLTRSGLLEALGSDFVRTARAKGLSRPRIREEMG
jgi:oligopeptide transport system permease protein